MVLKNSGLKAKMCLEGTLPLIYRAKPYSQIIPNVASLLSLRPRPYSQLTPKDQSKVERFEAPPPQRVTYEYPPPPKRAPKPPKQSTPFRKHLPIIIGAGTLIWAVYAYTYLFGNKERSQTVLDEKRFTKFKITNKQEENGGLVLVEIAPKYAEHLELLRSGGSKLWNGKKLWSIEVKHPDLQIVRKYTPLPMYYMHAAETEPLLRLTGSNMDQGRIVLLVKRYDDGEMSRYIHDLPVGAEIEIRGPFIEHKFKYSKADMGPMREPMVDIPSRLKPDKIQLDAPKPDNIAFFVGGTGIAPALQCLLSANPPRGMTNVYVSVRSRSELVFSRYMLFLEKVGRAKFHVFVDDENKFIQLNDIPEPALGAPQSKQDQPSESNALERNQLSETEFLNALQQYQYLSKHGLEDTRAPAYAVVCGPNGYVNYVAGDPGYDHDLPLGGLLAKKGWTVQNATRLSNL